MPSLSGSIGMAYIANIPYLVIQSDLFGMVK